jgi:hypothetical protein
MSEGGESVLECLRDLNAVYAGAEGLTPAAKRLGVLLARLVDDPASAATADAIFNFSLSDQTPLPPIVDVRLVHSKKNKDVPPGFTRVRDSIQYKHTGNVNSNGKDVYLVLRRAGARAAEGKEPLGVEPTAITSLAVALPSLGEEPYMGFEQLQDDLNVGTKGQTGNTVNLCFLRGSGAPVVNVAVVHPKEELPAAYKRICVTPFGHMANVNSNHKIKTKPEQGVYLAFEMDISPLLKRFRPEGQVDTTKTGDTEVKQSASGGASCEALLAALLASLFVADQDTAIAALTIFKKKIQHPAIPARMMNKFLCTLCDCAPGFLSYFSTDKGLGFLVHFLGFCFRRYLSVLELDTVMRIVEVCFLIRHEDKETKSSAGLLTFLCKNIDACGLCPNCDGRNAQKTTKKSTLSGQACVKCRQNAFIPAASEGKGAPAGLISKAVILQTLQHLSLSKALEPHVNAFHRESAGAAFRARTADLTRYLGLCKTWYTEEDLVGLTAPSPSTITSIPPPPSKSVGDNAFVAFILTCCKFATVEAPSLQRKSEALKRRLHALTLLLHVVRTCGSFFRSTPGTIMLLRRFVMTSLIQVLKTPHSATWRVALQIFSALRSSCEDLIMIEQGLLIQKVFLRALDSELTPISIKKDIVDVFFSIFATPEDLVHVYYNYDNHGKAWPVFTEIVDTMAHIVEGDVKSQTDDKRPEPKRGETQVENGAAPSREAEDSLRTATRKRSSARSSLSSSQAIETEDEKSAEMEYKEFRMHCTRLLTLVVLHLAKWVGVHGLAGGRASVIDMRLVNSNLDMKGKVKSNKSKVDRKISRTNTWTFRFDQQKMDQKVVDKALYLARTESLKNALKYLRAVAPSSAVPMEVAKFFRDYAHLLDPVQMGDILGDLDDSWMDESDYAALRVAFVSLMDFSKMTLDRAMRLYLCDSGFRLPGEAQKIDRLTEALCMAYCRDNPTAYEGGIDAAQTLAFAMIMLNTDLHDPRLQAARKKNGRKAMTVDQFVHNLRGCNAGGNFDRDMLRVVYGGVKNHPILWVEKNGLDSKTTVAKTEAQCLEECKVFMADLVRKVNADMRANAAYQQGRNKTESKSIVNGIFEQNWFRLISAFRGKSHFQEDASSLAACIDGYVYGGLIAITLGLRIERQAFAEQLAVITYEANAKGNSRAEVRKRKQGFARGEHLNQDWHKPLNVLAEKQPQQACLHLLAVGKEYKMKIAFDREQAKLEQLQLAFGNDIRLMKPSRHFVMQGPLLKLNKSGGKQTYKVYLFNDLLLYANGSKVHRVLHLSLCRLIDVSTKNMRTPFVFRVESAQKTVTFAAKSQKQKDLWLRNILANLRTVIQARKQYVDQMVRNDRSEHVEVAQDDDFAAFRRISSFVGSMDRTTTEERKNNECKLCIRSFGVFRRKVKCLVCKDAICGDCYKNKCKITPSATSAKNVCDSCFGVIEGFLHADQQMQVRVEGGPQESAGGLQVHSVERKSMLTVHS